MAKKSFFAELRRRRVFQAAAIYGAVAWGVTEILVTVVEQLFLPQWVSTLAVIGFVVGFPVAMFLSWTFDITSEGIQRTEIGSRRGKASIALSIVLLVAGTAGLFFLIRPSIQVGHPQQASPTQIVPNSIAVLPFENSGQDPADDYLSKGLSDELRDQLGRIVELRIAARSSSIAVLTRGMDATAASASLGVAHVVEGSLRRQGNRLRVSVQLIEGATGLALWSDTYERGARELLSVQQNIAEQIVRMVLPDADGITGEPATYDADANELLLLAHHYEQKVRDRQVTDIESLLKAIELYRQAVDADPQSALAHSRLAGAQLMLGEIEAAEAPIFKALSLNPNLSEVQNTLGEFYWARGMPEAKAAFTRAVEINPNNADALHNYANLISLSVEGQADGQAEPDRLLRRALELDPLSLSRHAALGEHLGYFGFFSEVPPVIEGIRGLFDDAEAYRVIGWLYELTGEVDHAIAWTIRARDLEPDNPDHVGKLAELYAVIDDFDTALMLEPSAGVGLLFRMRQYEDMIDLAEFLMIEEPEDIELRYVLAFAHVATGRFEAAIHVLRTTGLPNSIIEDMPRSASEIEAFTTLINALLGSGTPTAIEAANSLMQWQEGVPFWGEIGWIGLFKSCFAVQMGQHEEALAILPLIKKSPRLRRAPLLYDSWCMQQLAEEPVYLDVLRDQEDRKARLREKLPTTLSEIGVGL